MANTWTETDVNRILNEPGIFYFRPYGSSDSYTKAVFVNGAEFNYTPEKTTVGFDDTGEVFDAIGKETGEIKFSYGQPLNLDFMESLAGGLFTKTTTSAGALAIENQVIAADWTNKSNITLELIDASGNYHIGTTEPAITSVTGATAGLLTADDDYTIVSDPNSYSGFSIILNTAGTAGLVTTEAVTIVYNTPTVVGKTTLSGGGLKNYDAIEGYFETTLKGGQTAKVIFYKGFYNANVNTKFGTEDSPEAATSDVAISLKKDGSRSIGSQIFSLEVEEL